MTNQERMIELANETAQFYNSENRGVDTEHVRKEGAGEAQKCVYKNKQGNYCAIGRHLTEEHFAEMKKPGSLLETETVFTLFDHFESEDIELPEKLKGLNIQFMTALQGFHDQTLNWNKEGMTPQGEMNLKALILNINDKHYED